MKSLFGLLVLVVVLAGIAALVRRLLGEGERELPYERRGPMLSAAERGFYAVLCEAARARDREAVVMAQVPISQLIKVKRGTEQWRSWHNKIDRKTVDFVVLDGRTFEVVAAVELDDRSHQRADRRQRDAFVEEAMAAAGVKLVRVACRRGYRVQEIVAALGGAGREEPGDGGPRALGG